MASKLRWVVIMAAVAWSAGAPTVARSDSDVCWRRTVTRGVGGPLGCSASEDYDWGLCYGRCPTGFGGVGPICWKSCPEGYRDDGLFCAKGNYSRGVGTPMPCGGKEQDTGLCYPKCDATYTGVGPICWQHCPSDFDDIGVSCEKPNVSRGVGTPIHTCEPGKDQDAGLCYPPCGAGLTGAGPVCWHSCPASHPVGCGAGCAKTSEACAKSIGEQSVKTIETVAKLIMEDFKGAIQSGLQAANSFNLPLCNHASIGSALREATRTGQGWGVWTVTRPPFTSTTLP